MAGSGVVAVPEDRADRELLFEALAVHLGFLSRRAWLDLAATRPDEASPAGPRSLGELLVERTALTAEQCAVLETLVEGLLQRHGGDVSRCLDALSAFGRLRGELERRRVEPASGHFSTNPTVPSIPINGNRQGSDPGPGPGPEPAEDSLAPGGSVVPEDQRHGEPA